MKRPLPANFAVESESIANKAMERFDKDRDGRITFNEFMQILCSEPWAQLLPAGVTADLREMVMGSKGLREESVKVDASSQPVLELLEAFDIPELDARFQAEGFI